MEDRRQQMAQKQMQGIAPSPMTPMTRLLEEVSVCASSPVDNVIILVRLYSICKLQNGALVFSW